MPVYRKTAVVHIELPSGAISESLPLTTDRTFGVMLTIDGQSFPAGYFRSPISDEQWREFSRRLSICNTTRDEKQQDLLNRHAMFIRGIGQSLYNVLSGLSPELQAFLDRTGTPRRLVVQSTRPELHLLPWGALFDNGGNLLAAGGLSIVQSWKEFSQAVAVTQSKMTVLRLMGDDTPGATINGFEDAPAEIVVVPDTAGADPDILHVEAHGDPVTHEIDDMSSTRLAKSYGKPKIALLWSCFSSSSNSWGDSPALSLHRQGAAMVLSFQAELHVNDAASLSQGFYREVFGAAASRDPETALVNARAAKYQNEFAYANWASMTVYLASPLDLSALPLNGPRTPASRWSDPAAVAVTVAAAASPTKRGRPAPDPWAAIAEKIHDIEPGNWKQMPLPDGIDLSQPLPRAAFGWWRGNVILLEGCEDPLSRDVLLELDMGRLDPPRGDPAERLVWFFERIAHYGSPLVVWVNSRPHHLDFLKAVEPDAALSFLLLTGPEPTEETATIAELVDLNNLKAACARGTLLLELAAAGVPPSDEDLFAAYFASCREERPEDAAKYLRQIDRLQEWLLLTGNLMSRRDKRGVRDLAELLDLGGRFMQPEEESEDPNGTPAAAGDYASRAEFEALHRPEDFYRLALNQPTGQSTLRETARAKHELAYLKQAQGRPGTAEMLYRLALEDLMACGRQDAASVRDPRWRFAISSVLRDLADLLSSREDRLDDASALLKRAMAIQSFHGMRLQLGYSETTAAKIALTGGRHTKAIHLSVNAANRMEECHNFRGWQEALGILFDTLAETRETARMIAVANLAGEKIRAALPDKDDRAKQERLFKFEKGRAHWIAGDVVEARDELESIASNAADEDKSPMDREVDHLLAFLRVTQPRREKDISDTESTEQK